jgi:hypothetical protein
MFGKKRQKNDRAGTSHLSQAAFAACLALGCAGVVFSAENTTDSTERTTLRLAPIRLSTSGGGSVFYKYRYNSSQNISDSSQTVGLGVYSNITAYSFIWQPWLARVNAGVGVNLNNGFSSSSSSSSGKSQDTKVSDKLSLALLPRSRFPLTATVFQIFGRQNNGLTASKSTMRSTNVTLQQSYRSIKGKTSVNTIFSHNMFASSNSSLDKIDSLSIELSHSPLAFQTVSIAGNILRENKPPQSYRSLISNLVAKHTYKPNNKFSVSSLFSIQKTGTLQNNNANTSGLQQFSSRGNWQSLNNSLRLTGAARMSKSLTQPNGASALSFSAIYPLSKSISTSGSINVTDVNGIQTLTTNMSLSSSKAFADITKIAGFVYKRYLSAGLSNQNSTNSNNSQSSTNSQSLSLSLGHSLTNNMPFAGSTLISNINQTLSTGVSSNSSSTPNVQLSTSGSTSWRYSEITERAHSTFLRINASDSRSLSNSTQSLGSRQILNLQGLRDEKLPHFQTLVGNLTMQLSRQGASASSQSSQSAYATAELRYTNLRALKIRNMSFSSTLQISKGLTRSQTEDSSSWENNLEYVLGKLEFKSNARILRINSSQQFALLFSMQRNF